MKKFILLFWMMVLFVPVVQAQEAAAPSTEESMVSPDETGGGNSIDARRAEANLLAENMAEALGEGYTVQQSCEEAECVVTIFPTY